MTPPQQEIRAPSALHTYTIALRRSLLITVTAYDYGADIRYTVTIQDLQNYELRAPDLAAGTGNTEAEALGYALLDLADKTPDDHTRPYILNPERPDEPKFDLDSQSDYGEQA